MTLSAFKIFLKKELCFLYNDDEIQIIFFELIDSFLKISKIKYITDYNKVLLDRDIITLNNKINQLKDNMPIQYVVGKKKNIWNKFQTRQKCTNPKT